MLRRIGAVLGAAIALAAVPASRADDANRECDNNQDVTIVVDFASLGGGVNVRCAPQPINNGFDVFRRANVSYERVNNSELVCRIAGKPGSDTEDCTNTPPGNAYWGYWTANRGGEWKYQNYGPGARKPPPGSIDGWSFQTGTKTPPRYPVPQPVAEPTTTTTVAATDAPTTTTRGRSSVGSATTTAPTAPPTSTTAVAATSTTGASETSTSLALGHVDLSQSGNDGGTSLGFVLSALGVVSLGALGVAFARRRGAR